MDKLDTIRKYIYNIQKEVCEKNGGNLLLEFEFIGNVEEGVHNDESVLVTISGENEPNLMYVDSIFSKKKFKKGFTEAVIGDKSYVTYVKKVSDILNELRVEGLKELL